MEITGENLDGLEYCDDIKRTPKQKKNDTWEKMIHRT